MANFNQVPSRYKYTPQALIKDSNTTYNIITGFRNPNLSNIDQNYSLYTVKEGDTLQSIAIQLYDSPEYAFALPDFNPESDLLFWPDNIKNIVGRTIKVPKKSILTVYR